MRSDKHNLSAVASKYVKTTQSYLLYRLPLTRLSVRHLPVARATLRGGCRRMRIATDKTHQNRISYAVFSRRATVSEKRCLVVRVL